MEKHEFELEKEKAQSVISELHHVYEDVKLMIKIVKTPKKYIMNFTKII